jgi:hypothetical protein
MKIMKVDQAKQSEAEILSDFNAILDVLNAAIANGVRLQALGAIPDDATPLTPDSIVTALIWLCKANETKQSEFIEYMTKQFNADQTSGDHCRDLIIRLINTFTSGNIDKTANIKSATQAPGNA